MTTFSAADSALGYLYQVRVALLWSLRRARAGADFVVSLETLDDVTFESLQATGAKPDELLQTKHHRKSEASLSFGGFCGTRGGSVLPYDFETRLDSVSGETDSLFAPRARG